MSICLEKVCYGYEQAGADRRPALCDVDLDIGDGEFVGIIGRTGSGKSTLVQHLNGLIRPTSGRVLCDGEDIHAKGYPLVTMRRKVGLVFQYPEYQLFADTVFADVAFGPRTCGFDAPKIDECVRAALRLVEVDEALYKANPLELSGGQKRRVAIAGVLAMDPTMLILDEPTVGLDPQGRDQILGQVSRMHRERGMTIVLVSHDMDIVSRLVQRVVVLDDGAVLADGSPRQIFSKGAWLEGIGLATPQLTRLVCGLSEKGFDLDTDVLSVCEAKRAILAAIGKKSALTDVDRHSENKASA